MELLHSVTKSRAAFLMSASRLFEVYPKVYFWTFTFKNVLPDWKASMRWTEFLKELGNIFGQNVPGIRVVEVHPSEWSHGLHYHVLIAKRISIHLMRRIGEKYDFGHMWVIRAEKETAHYLAKYILKENDLSKGMRKWACIGGFQGVKVGRIEVDSMLTRNIKYCQNKCKVNKFTYAFFLYVRWQTKLHGGVESWPIQKKITPFYMAQKTVDQIEYALPDDDGVTYYDLSPLKTKFEKLVPLKLNRFGEYETVYVAGNHDCPF